MATGVAPTRRPQLTSCPAPSGKRPPFFVQHSNHQPLSCTTHCLLCLPILVLRPRGGSPKELPPLQLRDSHPSLLLGRYGTVPFLTLRPGLSSSPTSASGPPLVPGASTCRPRGRFEILFFFSPRLDPVVLVKREKKRPCITFMTRSGLPWASIAAARNPFIDSTAHAGSPHWRGTIARSQSYSTTTLGACRSPSNYP